MSFETGDANPQLESVMVDMEDVPQDDGKSSLAMAGGIAAALIGGAIWAGIVLITKMEIGWVAWGVGALVGLAMTQLTKNRTPQLAYTAAVYAVLGLLLGKAFIFAGSAGIIAKEIEQDASLLNGSVAWQLYQARELSAPTLEAIDAAVSSGNELSDAIWADMQAQASTRVGAMTADQRHAAALTAAKGSLDNVGMWEGIRSQLSAFDLLWIFLAVGTAFRMVAPRKQVLQAA